MWSLKKRLKGLNESMNLFEPVHLNEHLIENICSNESDFLTQGTSATRGTSANPYNQVEHIVISIK